MTADKVYCVDEPGPLELLHSDRVPIALVADIARTIDPATAG